MTFDELLTQVYDLLQRQGRLSYRALNARFQLDDDLLEALKDELIYAQRVAADEDGRVVVWMGETASTSPSAGRVPAGAQERQPLSYTPAHLAEKILTSPQRARRRTQAGHGAVCGPEGVHGAAGRARP